MTTHPSGSTSGEWWAVCANREGLVLAVWGPYSMRETAAMVAAEKGGERRGVTVQQARPEPPPLPALVRLVADRCVPCGGSGTVSTEDDLRDCSRCKGVGYFNARRTSL